MPKGFFITGDGEAGFVFIAESFDEAMQMTRNSDELGDYDIEELNGWESNGDITGLKLGTIVDIMDGLARGLYEFAENQECPMCHLDGIIWCENCIVGCADCLEKE